MASSDDNNNSVKEIEKMKAIIISKTEYSVTFQINAQKHKDGQFSVTKNVCDALGLKGGDMVSLVITSPQGRDTFKSKLSSGTEIYGTKIAELVKAGDPIEVEISRA